MNTINTSFATTKLLITLTLATLFTAYPAEKSRQLRAPMPLPQPRATVYYEPAIMPHDYNNEIWVESEKLSECVHFEFSTRVSCCGSPYTTSETTPMGSSDYLFKTCRVEKKPNGKSVVSFYNYNFNEPKKTVSAREGSIFKILKIADDIIIITRGKNFRDENHKEVARFTLKK